MKGRKAPNGNPKGTWDASPGHCSPRTQQLLHDCCAAEMILRALAAAATTTPQQLSILAFDISQEVLGTDCGALAWLTTQQFPGRFIDNLHAVAADAGFNITRRNMRPDRP